MIQENDQRLRYYGGHYDCMKQRQLLLNLNDIYSNHLRKRSYNLDPLASLIQIYNARLKLDMLLTGKIIITDAQLMDGTFWLSLAKHSLQASDFVKFLGSFSPETLPIEIKIRCNNLEESYRDFVLRGGFFSLYLTDSKIAQVQNAFLSCKEDLLKRKKSSIDSWFKIIKANLDNDVQSEFEEHRQFVNFLIKSIPDNICSPYNPDTYMRYVKKVKNDVKLEDWLTKDHIHVGIKELVNTINNQLDPKNNLSPDRKVTFNKISEIKQKYPNDAVLIHQCNELFNAMSYIYNHAIALQHKCGAIDEGVMHIKKDSKDRMDYIGLDLGILPENIKYFGNLPWDLFFSQFYHPIDIKSLRSKWFQNIGNKNSTERIDTQILNDYVKAILKYKSPLEHTTTRLTSAIVTLMIEGTLFLAGGSDINLFHSNSLSFIQLATSAIPIIIELGILNENKQLSTNLVNIGLSNITNIREAATPIFDEL
ncbi:MAG TPA: hypothetical protein PLE74_07715 [Candidatus Cloacimonadota bacterium]|nr:hypothetical protein [Candidatus Cloacimonadota bacterium]HPT72152.1 hypothetical protein [Candidatus Cloacimonadota bacterium]